MGTSVAWGYAMRTTAPLEARVVSEVEARRGGGVVWVLYVEPLLGGAL